MNAAQMQGMRMMADTFHGAAEKMTAVKMAQVSHKLNKSGDVATMSDGSRWVWGAGFFWNQSR